MMNGFKKLINRIKASRDFVHPSTGEHNFPFSFSSPTSPNWVVFILLTNDDQI